MANVNERFTNYDEFEFAQQNREAAKRKKEIMAKRLFLNLKRLTGHHLRMLASKQEPFLLLWVFLCLLF